MGIYPNVLMRPLEGTTTFPTLEDAVEHFAPRMGVETGGQRAILRDYFRTHLIRQADGLALAGSSTYAAIWWQKRW
jgi:hypothetical protein